MRLSRKSHAGHLEFDHPEEKLALSVQRNSQDQVPTDRQQPTSRPAECPVAHRQRPRTDRPTVSSAPTPSPDQSHTNPEPAPVHPSTRPPVHPSTRAPEPPEPVYPNLNPLRAQRASQDQLTTDRPSPPPRHLRRPQPEATPAPTPTALTSSHPNPQPTLNLKPSTRP
eukprot:4861974-Prymnesium_polylepis.1